MENSKENDAKMLAIMQFIHHYDSRVSLQSLINGLSFEILLSNIPPSQFNFSTITLNKKAIKWSEQLQNLQTILLKIQQYFLQVHEKCIETANIDLIGITKRQQLGQLIKYFEIVMALLMQSSQKQGFVQTIMMLQQSSQQLFVQIIKTSLNRNTHSSPTPSRLLSQIIQQFQQQKQTMSQQISRLCKANTDLLEQIKQYEQTINQLSVENSEQKSFEQSVDEGKNVKYLEEYIDRLQARIIEITKVHEEDKNGYQDKLNDLQNKVQKLEQMEALCKIYKEKYDQIMGHMQKMNIWKREKAKMEKLIEEKDFIISKINDRIEQLSEKNLVLEESELQLKMQVQKKQLKIQKMSNELRKAMQNINNVTTNSFSTKLNQSFLQERSVLNSKPIEQSMYNNEDELFQVRKQHQKSQKKCKQLQKEICKMNKKMQKLRILEEDKVKLQQLVFQLRTVHSEQINLMLSVFYDAFEQNKQVSKQYKNVIQNTEHEIRRTDKKRKGSLLLKSKQNFKLARNSKC